jgi:putative transposase
MIEREHSKISVIRQCKILTVNRSSIYYKAKPIDPKDAVLTTRINQIYENCPFYGYRRINAQLARENLVHNIKRTRRLMKTTGLKGICPKPQTTLVNKAHKKYPYLLKDVKITRPNQVWQVDITYIKLAGGFVYLTCLVDIFSRKIMGWALSPFLDTATSLEALEKALKITCPEMINSDQGCQFTSREWIEKLHRHNIKISMDGKGRWADNIFIERLWRTIKYEFVFLHSFHSIDQFKLLLDQYLKYYNEKRLHQTLKYLTPDEVYHASLINNAVLLGDLPANIALSPQKSDSEIGHVFLS